MRHIGIYFSALVVALVFALSLIETEASGFEPPYQYHNGMRINRRGFKSSLLSTARGFGKRSDSNSLSAEMLAREAARDPRVMSILFRHFDEDGDGVLTENELNL